MVDGQLSLMINRISEELSMDECRRLMYLCGDLRPHCSAEDVRRTLKSMSCREADRMFLVELVLRMKRFDILKKVLRTSRQEAEGMLRNGYFVSEYRVLMADVSQDMSKEDLNSLIFLLSGKVPREQLEKATSFLDVVVELEMLDEVSCDKVDLIRDCLRNVRRLDLAKRVQQYQMRAAGERPQSNSTLRGSTETQQCLRKIPSCVMFPPRAPPSSPATRCWTPTPAHAPVNFKLAVPEPGRQFCQAPAEAYRMRAEPRGVCLIIDCVGSDGDMLEQTFRQLHFKVILYKWLSVGDTLSVLREISRATEHRGADAFVCCVLSRATATDLLATEPQGPGLCFDAVRQLFTVETCPWLAGKPKLFFIQSYGVPVPCSAFVDEDLETDGLETEELSGGRRWETVPEGADVVWSQCTTDAQQLENSMHQSVYMQSLSTTLLKGQRRGMHLLDVLTEVNRRIYDHNQKHRGEAYHISLRHTLRKNLFI